jgi:cobalt-zinc-cadmium efflux system outer membrane protein
MRWLKVALLASLLASPLGLGAAWAQLPAGSAPPVPAGAGGPVDFPSLWALALANNPTLREAAAGVEEARGQRLQAGKYPNPTISYAQEYLGAGQAPAGAITVQVNQEIVTAGKRRLDIAVANQGTEIAAVALTGKKFEVLTATRHGYYNYLAANELIHVQGENVTTLETAVKLTRKLVEGPKGSLPRADLLRVESLLAGARINQTRNHIKRAAIWRQLAAEVGVPGLPPPACTLSLPDQVPEWCEEAILQRVLVVHTDLREAALEVERARLEYNRARAGAVPNVQVGGGYARDFLFGGAAGGLVTLETSLPLWDRRQGEIHEAEARWARAQAAQQTTTHRLSRETAEAFGRYLSARQQVQRVAAEVLPGLDESFRLIRETYEGGNNPEGFVDLQTAAETINEARIIWAEARQTLWEAIVDLQGLMQLDLGEEACSTHP